MQKMTRVEVLLLFRKDYTKQSQAAEVQLKGKVVLLWAGLSTDLKFNSRQYWTPSSWFRVWLAFCFVLTKVFSGLDFLLSLTLVQRDKQVVSE